MKVKDLISKLNKIDPELEVHIYTENSCRINSVYVELPLTKDYKDKNVMLTDGELPKDNRAMTYLEL